MVPAQQSSSVSRFLAVLLFLSGWLVAAWIGFRAYRTPPQQDITVPPTPSIAETFGESASDKVARIFQEWSATPDLEGAAVGFSLLDEEGEPIFASPLASVALCPASSLKTVTSGAALHILGPEFRFETQLASTAPLGANGSIEGDLILIGSGDPTLSSEDLANLAMQAVTAGLKNVTGQLRADASAFPEHAASDFWNWGDIGNYYGAGAYGINVDHNAITISFEPGAKTGAPAQVLATDPVLRDVQWSNHVTTGPEGSGDQVVVYSEPYGRKITLRGTVPLGESGFTVRGAIPDPPAHALDILTAALDKLGVKIAGEAGPFARDMQTPLAKHQSPPLPEIIDHLHRVSDNLETQCLFLTMGRLGKAPPSEIVREFYEKAGVSFAGFRMLDGSGLARANTIRPLDLAAANFAARKGAHGKRFFESLTSYANGAIRAKRGAMSGVKTEVGFLRTHGGRELTYAVMGNALARGVDFWSLKQKLLNAVSEADL